MHTDNHISSAYLQMGGSIGYNSVKLLILVKGVLKLM